MRILLVHNYYSHRGGEDVYFDNLTELLRKRGHSVYTYTKNSSSAQGLRGKLSALMSLFFLNGRVKNEFQNTLKKFKPDVVHFNNLFPLIGPIAYQVCRKENLPIVQTIHNYRLLPDIETSLGYDNYHSNLYKNLFRMSINALIRRGDLSRVDCFLFPSKQAFDVYKKNARFGIRKHAIVANFVDRFKYKKPKRSDFFLFAGRFSKEKGVLPLLDIFSALPHLKLVVVGDGPEKNKVAGYGKYKNIRIKGWIDRKVLHKYMSQALALVSPSLSLEVMPLSVIESLVLKTPVIVPKKGTFMEIIKKPSDGVFFRDKDFDDLKEKIKNFKTDRKVNTNYAEYYSPQKHYSDIIRVYERLIH